jgi:hypothetical protein
VNSIKSTSHKFFRPPNAKGVDYFFIGIG